MSDFRYDSWEWWAYQIALQFGKEFLKATYGRSTDWEQMWNDVFINEVGVDWPIARLAMEGFEAAHQHGFPYATYMDGVKFLAGKQRDYGNDNILKFGVEGIKVRSSDKVERIKNLLKRNEEGNTEPIADAYFDLWGYMVVYRMVQLGVFTKPLQADMGTTKSDIDVSTETKFPVEVCYGDLVVLKMMFDEGGNAMRKPDDHLAYVYVVEKYDA